MSGNDLAPDAMLSLVAHRYPGLARYTQDAAISQGRPEDANGRLLEFYSPQDSENPTPGKIHLQTFSGNITPETIAGDMLHHVGGFDPATNQPIDPKFQALRQSLLGSRTPMQEKVDRDALKRDQQQFGDTGSFDDWMNRSRLDAYVRAGVFPSENPEWAGYLTPQQREISSQMLNYLRTPQE